MGTIGSGLSVVSMDSDYQDKRRESKKREQARGVLSGVGYGLKEFGGGLFEGMTGVIVCTFA